MGYAEKSMVIDAPVSMCYQYWSNVANYPRFMSSIVRVEPGAEIFGEENLFHWVSRLPSGDLMAWDMVLEEVVPNRLIAWRSASNYPIFQTEIVHFDPLPLDRCRVTLTRTSHLTQTQEDFSIQRLDNPETILARDLQKFKHLMETSGVHTMIRMVPEKTVNLDQSTQNITGWPVIRVHPEKQLHPQDAPGDMPDIAEEYSTIGVSETTKTSEFEPF